MRSAAVVISSILGIGVILTACGDDQSVPSDDVQSVPSDHVEPAPCFDEFQPLVLEPSTARAGERFTVRYPTRAPTTEHLMMSRITDTACTSEYVLYRDGDKVSWAKADGATAIITGEFKRVASHPAVVPDDADAGTYQVCAPAPRPGKVPACGVLTVKH